jgi:hypothetical protein
MQGYTSPFGRRLMDIVFVILRYTAPLCPICFGTMPDTEQYALPPAEHAHKLHTPSYTDVASSCVLINLVFPPYTML